MLSPEGGKGERILFTILITFKLLSIQTSSPALLEDGLALPFLLPT
jgi:hypothetical protein